MALELYNLVLAYLIVHNSAIHLQQFYEYSQTVEEQTFKIGPAREGEVCKKVTLDSLPVKSVKFYPSTDATSIIVTSGDDIIGEWEFNEDIRIPIQPKPYSNFKICANFLSDNDDEYSEVTIQQAESTEELEDDNDDHAYEESYFELKVDPNDDDTENIDNLRVSGVTFINEDLYIIHRNGREFGNYEKPIEAPVIRMVDKFDGVLTDQPKLGAGKMYLPHGISSDHKGNIWTTDVSAHIVLKIDPNEDKVLLQLGTPHKSGNDAKHFCKPTDVAVTENGDIYIADGYCNSRVAVFNEKGSHLRDITSSDGMKVVHSISIKDKKLFVADRNNARVLVFNIGSGALENTLESSGFVYGVCFDEKLYVLNDASKQSVTVNYKENKVVVVDDWGSDEFEMPHDVAVYDGVIYVADLESEKQLLKFTEISH